MLSKNWENITHIIRSDCPGGPPKLHRTVTPGRVSTTNAALLASATALYSSCMLLVSRAAGLSALRLALVCQLQRFNSPVRDSRRFHMSRCFTPVLNVAEPGKRVTTPLSPEMVRWGFLLAVNVIYSSTTASHMSHSSLPCRTLPFPLLLDGVTRQLTPGFQEELLHLLLNEPTRALPKVTSLALLLASRACWRHPP